VSHFIRVWQACDIESLSKHLVIVGDITGDCANCRELGIDYAQAKACPGCGNVFRFVALRSKGGSRGAAVKRIKERRPDLTFVDYDDYKEITGRSQAHDFFK
jgi:hypothetical protein